MSRDCLIAVSPGEIRCGLVEDGRIVELRIERISRKARLGQFFLARIARVAPATDATFLDLDDKRLPGFLPGLTAQSGDKLIEGQALAVQVVKEAFADKPAEVTSALSVTGALLTLTPQRAGVAVSRQLPAAERARLSDILVPLLTANEGVIARTRAQGASTADLSDDLDRLRARYEALQIEIARGLAPRPLEPEQSGLSSLIASFDPAPDRLLVDNRAAFAALRPLGIPVALETDMSALDAAFAAACSSDVALHGAADLVIENTTGFTAIDVNLGEAASGRSQSGAAIRTVNLDAARMIAAELRLRQIGGAVVIDFVSMKSRQDRDLVEAALADAVKDDPAGMQLLGWTRLGHYELTRRRRGPSLAQTMLDQVGRKTAETVALEAIRAIARTGFHPGRASLHVAPPVAALLQGAFAEFLAEAIVLAGRPTQIIADPMRDAETFDLNG